MFVRVSYYIKKGLTYLAFATNKLTNGFASGIMERRKLRPHQSVSSSSSTPAGTLNKSQSTGELASRNDNGNGNTHCLPTFLNII